MQTSSTTFSNTSNAEHKHIVLDPKVGFDLGYDYYCMGAKRPDYSQHCPDFMQGYNAAKERVSPKENDRFIRKWLQLRYNAWKRGRIFDDAITPEFIRMIDVTHCPITGIKLTHSTKQDTDWSVDRIQNNAAYVPGNLVVVSVRANAAKADLDYHLISHLASGDPELDDLVELSGLTTFEWRRWQLIASLCSSYRKDDGTYGYNFTLAPAVIEPPLYTLQNPSVILQMALSSGYGTHTTGLYKRVLARLPARIRPHFIKLARHAEKQWKKGNAYQLDVWHSPTLFSKFVDFYHLMTEDEVMKATEKLCIHESTVMPFLAQIDWHADTSGYTIDRHAA